MSFTTLPKKYKDNTISSETLDVVIFYQFVRRLFIYIDVIQQENFDRVIFRVNFFSYC